MFRFRRIVPLAVLVLLVAGIEALFHWPIWIGRPAPAGPLPARDVMRSLAAGGLSRHYRMHIPKKYDASRATPIVLAFHGATDTAEFLEEHCQLDQKSDSAGFIVVYPEVADPASADTLHWNASSPPGGIEYPDDVDYTAKLLDDLATVVNVDRSRVFATGISNGGMMCYRLAAELPDRIAAIAPIAATMGLPEAHPIRPVPIIAFHGTADPAIPFETDPFDPDQPTLRSAMETMALWANLDGCPAKPRTERLAAKVHDGTSVMRETFGPGRGGAEVILYVIQNGGHTWPGTPAYKAELGLSSQNVSADDAMWAFFQKHAMAK